MKKNKRKSTFAKERRPLGEIALKSSITFFCVALFFVLFNIFGGVKFFYDSVYADAARGSEFQIHTIDVENGDAFIIKLPNNKTMLIDCGEALYEKKVVSYVKQYLQSEKLNKIDYFVLTHPDSDHVGNAGAIFENFRVENLYRPKIYSIDESDYIAPNPAYKIETSVHYNAAISAAYKEGCNILFNEEGIKLTEGNASVQFLSPAAASYEKDNNYSAVLLIKYYSKSFLFMGDAEKEIEQSLINKYGDKLDVDVLKIGHHGSKSSTSEEFLNVVKPQYAILSCSKNSNVLPSQEIIERVENIGCQSFSTAKLGNFVIYVNLNQIYCNQANLGFNYWTIIFAAGLIGLLIMWKIPFLTKQTQKK